MCVHDDNFSAQQYMYIGDVMCIDRQANGMSLLYMLSMFEA